MGEIPNPDGKFRTTITLKASRMTQTNDNSRPGFRAKFTWGIDGSVLWLKDQGDECRSLTNDIENCLVELTPQLPTGSQLDDYHIIYRDSEGKWDAIVVTKLGNLSSDLHCLRSRSNRNVSNCPVNLKIRFYHIGLTAYDQAVQQLLADRMYRHANTSSILGHNLN